MASLAGLLTRLGYRVSGSDQGAYPPMSTVLEREGIEVRTPFGPGNLPGDCRAVIVGKRDLPREPGTRGGARPPPAARFLPGDAPGTGPAAPGAGGGCGHPRQDDHDLAARLDPADLGTRCRFPGRGGWRTISEGVSPWARTGEPFVVEGDEYDSAYWDKGPKFLHYLPEVAIIGNVEFDHADIYSDFAAVRRQFSFLARLPPRRGLLLLGADSPAAAELAGAAHTTVRTFSVAGGEGPAADWVAAIQSSGPSGSRLRGGVSRRGAAAPRGTFLGPGLGAKRPGRGRRRRLARDRVGKRSAKRSTGSPGWSAGCKRLPRVLTDGCWWFGISPTIPPRWRRCSRRGPGAGRTHASWRSSNPVPSPPAALSSRTASPRRSGRREPGAARVAGRREPRPPATGNRFARPRPAGAGSRIGRRSHRCAERSSRAPASRGRACRRRRTDRLPVPLERPLRRRPGRPRRSSGGSGYAGLRPGAPAFRPAQPARSGRGAYRASRRWRRRLGAPVSDRHAARRAAGGVSRFAPMGRREKQVPSVPVGSEGGSHPAGRRHAVRGAEHRACRSETGVPGRGRRAAE